ncbi:hypothetical protein A5742_17430 [Mycolicibacterium fortuitum]|uniref:Uncharacterized protein n=1 Tax=Mycolicibacterium fortuitum TaxID=1766 RepID=A0ABD6QSY6_MYCFO|nr:hypothetical protein [Mycolicibacterium fortuitum]OMC51920.1 hypothetical protein A5742_17430 [Mycolicibacterium fortuitum]
MASTRGRIIRLNWLSEIICIYLGSSLNNAELFTLQFLSSDTEFITEHKRLLSKMLTTALTHRRTIDLIHDDSGVVTGIDFIAANISPVGPPIHNDFYGITGSDIPGNAQLIFETTTLTVTVTPDFRRPHWVLVERLPAAVPIGPATVSLQSGAWRSDAVPVTVRNGPLTTSRTLYPGRTTTDPYTFVFAATPAFDSSGKFSADSILTNRTAFQDVVRHSLNNLLNMTEQLLRDDGLERNIRFVAIFDPNQPATAENALVGAVAPNIIEPKRDRLNAFVGQYWENPDIVFCISGSTTHTRASAWFTTDDNLRTGVAFQFDGSARTHRRYTTIPGSAAVTTSVDQSGLTVIHEFGHAASDFTNGMVIDLYVNDTRAGFVVNKKMRRRATDPIPANFASLDGTTVASDQTRDGLGYPTDWVSYHPALLDTTRPNMMDNYWLAATPQACRLDRLTFDWFGDRLRAKILR